MSDNETEIFDCVGYEIERAIANSQPYQLARRRSDGAFALVHQVGAEWRKHGPIVSLTRAMQIAEAVASGDRRVLTSPDMPLLLAVALIGIQYLWLVKSNPDGPPQSGSQEVKPGGDLSEPSSDAAGVAPSMSAGSAVLGAETYGQSEQAASYPPRHPSSCAECG